MAEVTSGLPIQMVATTAQSDFNYGYTLVKGSGNTVQVSTTVNDTILGVLDQSVVDEEQALRATRADESVGVWPLGCGRPVTMRSKASQTWTLGAAVYNNQTADTAGQVATSSSNSARKVGHYFGAGETTSSSDGDEIKVLLDVGIGE